MRGAKVLQASQFSLDLRDSRLVVPLLPVDDLVLDYGGPVKIILVCWAARRTGGCSPMARRQDDAAVLADTVIGDQGQVAESLFAVLDAFHPGRDVHDAEVEVDLC